MTTKLFAALAAAVLFSGCEDESNPTGPNGDPDLNVILTAGPFNASSMDALTHFSFESGTVVPSTADWDIAFRRYEVRLNGGVSGTKGVVGYSFDNNADASDAEVLAFTVDGTLPAFDAIREDDIPPDASFQSDGLIQNATGYLNLGGVPTANAAAYWKVKLANGSFALMRVTGITMSQAFALTSVTIESRLQSGNTLGAVQSVTVPVSGAPVSVNLVTNQVVTPNGCNWDVSVNPQSFGMGVNTACNVGTFPGPAAPAFTAATTANDAPEYAAFLAGMTGPIPNSITEGSAPFRYNLQGTNRLHPTFNTYLVKVGDNVYKLQLINYYDNAGASAHPTIRYALIR